ncbi:MAG: acetyl-CoA C-acetyltransferase [Myxococcales bacterium]|nr:acetyl-CoA C-acetyltransferase [Myxococcales bacterium]MCB9543834.1 acetyl-CoA C-acetyltransferase [Myxococcales bacterium]MCB9551835.1 acetyl-CoA C-acetyltransferase [Myxococcales bacterium]
MKTATDTGIVFLGAKRTAFGTFNGALKGHSATDLGVVAAKAALEQSGVAGEHIDHVVFGNVLQTSKDAIYLARHVGLRAGLPQRVPAVTVNRLCGSGFEAITAGAREILVGDAQAVLVGGTESMSQAPHVVRGAREGLRFGAAPELEDSLWSCLTDSYTGQPMAITAENLAEKYGISREACDGYALRSQRAWADAQAAGRYRDEITPVELATRKGPVAFDVDEHPRPDSDAAGLGKLKPVFKKDGTVTAGNASGICDGAAALVIASRAFAEKHGHAPLGRLVQWGVSGCDPTIMGIGPVPASRIALDRAGLSIGDMDVIEVNEAFAPQYLAVEQALELPRDRTNLDGGAIALGHPLGASGARIVAHLLYALRQRGGRYGLGTACIGGGQGIAVIVEAM